jgi:hypothetical protein
MAQDVPLVHWVSREKLKTMKSQYQIVEQYPSVCVISDIFVRSV